MEAAISPLPDDVEALKALAANMARKAEEAEQNAATATAQRKRCSDPTLRGCQIAADRRGNGR